MGNFSELIFYSSKINSLKMMFMHVVYYDVFDLSKADFDYFDLLKVYPPVRKNEKNEN